MRTRQNGWCLILYVRNHGWQAYAGKYGNPWPRWPSTQTDTFVYTAHSWHVQSHALPLVLSCTQCSGPLQPETRNANFEYAKAIRDIAASSSPKRYLHNPPYHSSKMKTKKGWIDASHMIFFQSLMWIMSLWQREATLNLTDKIPQTLTVVDLVSWFAGSSLRLWPQGVLTGWSKGTSNIRSGWIWTKHG